MKEKFPSVYRTVQILHFFKKVFSATAKSKKGGGGRGRKRVDFFHGDRSKGLSTPLEKKRQMSPRLWESGVTHFSAFFFSLIDDEKSGEKRTFPIFPDSTSHRKKGAYCQSYSTENNPFLFYMFIWFNSFVFLTRNWFRKKSLIQQKAQRSISCEKKWIIIFGSLPRTTKRSKCSIKEFFFGD